MDSNIIRDLVAWVECHLEEHLQLDDIAEKSGYSKWHLQRAFKEKTQMTLGTYVRYRRLSKVAADLRLTNDSLVDIAAKYRFESQQSFSRSFKHRFNMSPGVYRRSEKWTTRGILPAFYLESNATSNEYSELPEVSETAAQARQRSVDDKNASPQAVLDSVNASKVSVSHGDNKTLILNKKTHNTPHASTVSQEIIKYFDLCSSLIEDPLHSEALDEVYEKESH